MKSKVSKEGAGSKDIRTMKESPTETSPLLSVDLSNSKAVDKSASKSKSDDLNPNKEIWWFNGYDYSPFSLYLSIYFSFSLSLSLSLHANIPPSNSLLPFSPISVFLFYIANATSNSCPISITILLS
jgi:hypothetical protein